MRVLFLWSRTKRPFRPSHNYFFPEPICRKSSNIFFRGITNGAIYAVIALGFSMLFSATDLINFAHGEFVMLGGLGLVSLWGGFGMPLPIAFLLVIIGVAVVGFLLERLAIRTVKKPHPISLVIITVGVSILLRGVGMMIWGKDAHSVPSFSDHGPIDIAGSHAAAPKHLDFIHHPSSGSADLAFFKKNPDRKSHGSLLY